MDVKKPVGRFAPTPSGRMHLGNVFAALIAWLSVRSRDGEMVLRMEDLDTQRTSAEFAETLRQDLRWLGLSYDREQIPQSLRSEAYDGYFEILRDKGLLYPCYCTRSQLHGVNAAISSTLPKTVSPAGESACRTSCGPWRITFRATMS